MMVHDRFHEPVLAAESIAFLVRKPGIYIDGTLGGGGHASALLHTLHESGWGEQSLLIGIDQDEAALQQAAVTLARYKASSVLVKGNFMDIAGVIERVCRQKGVKPDVAGILLDLGVSSFQIDTAERGFSYLREGELDMRMDRGGSLCAADIINGYDERALTTILYKYGEEPGSRHIARAIISYRAKHGAINSTQELASIIRAHAYGGDKVIKILSRVFQALRIEVNHELDVLYRVLEDGIASLEEKGRMAVISYHSLEDRIVKNVFAEKARCDWGPKGVGLRAPLSYGTVRLVNRKPLSATLEEIASNSRARSAKLRVIEKISSGERREKK